jgi:hypothetical protein
MVEHKQVCVETCMQFLQQYCEEDALQQWIITSNGTWVHHYEPASVKASMQ